jgi:general secretion pathway protein D
MNRKAPLTTLAALLLTTSALAQPDTEPRMTDMDELIDRVAAEVGKEIVVDPRVPSEMRGYTTNNAADYESFQALLRINGYVAIETSDQILVIPEQNFRTSPSRLLQQDDRNVSDHEIVTRVITVPALPDRRSEAEIQAQLASNPFAGSNTSLAPQLVPVLRPMLSTAAQLAATPGTNQLIIVDYYDNVRRIAAIIDEIVAGLEE